MNATTLIPSKEVPNLAQLVAYIRYLYSELGTILWFRGQRDLKWKFVPGIYRDDHAQQERNYVHRFRSRAGTRYGNVPDMGDLALWLSLMQHYGLPTRLLDWTRSPLVAAYFAIEEQIYSPSSKPIDAVIWVLQPHTLNQIEVGENVTPNLQSQMCKPLVQPAFYHRARETNQVLAVMASEHDLRMFVQQGCFTIHSDSTAFNLRSTAPRYLHGIVIPASAVAEFAAEIEICGFRKGDIYPDLANLALELKKKKGQ